MFKSRDEMTELDFEDPIDWVYEVRRRISVKYGHDVKRYAAAMTEKMHHDEAHGVRKYIRLPIARRRAVTSA